MGEEEEGDRLGMIEPLQSWALQSLHAPGDPAAPALQRSYWMNC